MGLPRTLKQMAVWVDGQHYAGEATEFTPPTLESTLEDYRAGGMLGPVPIDLGMEALKATMKMSGWVAATIVQFGGHLGSAQVRLVEAVQADNTPGMQGIEHVMRGRLAKFDPGTAKVGDLTEHEYEYALDYYKLIDNGQVLVEVDYVNMICKIGENDKMEQIKRILGI